MASLEVTELVQRADALLEASPGLVLRRWRAHRRALRFEVELPEGLEAPLRPLFLSRAWADAIVAACAPGQRLPDVAMPSAVGVPGDFVLTEPPHGREWLLYAAYVDAMRAPWLDLLGLRAPKGAVEEVVAFVAAKKRAGPLAVVLSEADAHAVRTSHARVLQSLWRLEARLASRSLAPRVVQASELRRDERGAVRFASDGEAAGAVAWWSTPSLDFGDLRAPVWPAPFSSMLARRALPALAEVQTPSARGRAAPGGGKSRAGSVGRKGSREAPTHLGERGGERLSRSSTRRGSRARVGHAARYVATWLPSESPPVSAGGAGGGEMVFKPFDDAYAERDSAEAEEGAGVLQARVELPRTRLPFEVEGRVTWRGCGVEVGVLALGGRAVTAFARCVVEDPAGEFDVICPAVLVP
ncbi:MAG: hypothetical protein AB1938_17300 [Myxococcota bacterium]